MALVGGKIQIRTIYHLRKIYRYVRISIKKQNMDRQIQNI